jgi:uncharacterized membrane protein
MKIILYALLGGFVLAWLYVLIPVMLSYFNIDVIKEKEK